MMHNAKAHGVLEARIGPADLSGFTPVFDAVVQELGNTAANVFGVAWRYCQMSEGVCRASIRTIAERLRLSEGMVYKYLKLLVKANYLEDLTPGVRRVPHAYRNRSKLQPITAAAEASSDQPAVRCSNSAFASRTDASQTVHQALLKKQSGRDKEDSKRRAASGTHSPKAADVFELRLFRDVAGFYPPRLVFDEVIAAVQKIGDRLGRPPAAEDLRPFIKAWVANGWRPTNLAWLFEWAVSGAIPMKGSRNEKQDTRRIQSREQEKPITEQQHAAIQRINAARRSSAGVPEM